MKLRLRGDLDLDLELTERMQVPQVGEILFINGGFYRVREIRRGYVLADSALPSQAGVPIQRVVGWDVAVYLSRANVPADDTKGDDRG